MQRSFLQPNVLEMCLQSDILNVPGEEVVVTSLLRWIRHDLPQRQKLLPLLLSSTKLHHLPSLEVQYRSAGFGTWGGFVWFSILSDAVWRSSPSGERGLSGVDLRGSGSTASAQRPAHGRQAGHHADLHLRPQNRRERRHPPHLLLLSENQSVERCGKGSLGGSDHVSRPPRMLFY